MRGRVFSVVCNGFAHERTESGGCMWSVGVAADNDGGCGGGGGGDVILSTCIW